MIKRLFSYLVFGLTCTNLAFGMQKHNSDYLPVLEDCNKSPKSKHSLKTLLKNDTAPQGIINRYGAATRLPPTRYEPVLKDVKKGSKSYKPEAYDSALEWPLNEPISSKNMIKNYIRDQITVKNIAPHIGKMAGYTALNFSSTLAHEYGHALVSYYLQGKTTHIFLGKNSRQVDLNHEKLMLEKNKNKFPQFSFVGSSPYRGFCGSLPNYSSNNPYYEALHCGAGPIAGALFNLATIKALRSFGMKADNYTDGLMKFSIDNIVEHPFLAYIVKSKLTDNSLESEMHARLLHNIFNLLPLFPSVDGYKLLASLSSDQKVNAISNIVSPLFALSVFSTIGAFGAAKTIKYIDKIKDPIFYKENFIDANGKELTDTQTILKLAQKVYSKLKGKTN